MEAQLVVAVSALLGVVVGGLVNYVVTTRSKAREWRLALVREWILERQKLYAEFLVTTQELGLQSIREKATNTKPFDVMSSALARIELVATEPVVAAAKKMCGHVINAHHTEPAPTERLLHHEKADFIRAVRAELAKLEEA